LARFDDLTLSKLITKVKLSKREGGIIDMIKVHEIAMSLIFPRWFCKDIILAKISLIIDL
jgi:hypothetical protein